MPTQPLPPPLPVPDWFVHQPQSADEPAPDRSQHVLKLVVAGLTRRLHFPAAPSFTELAERVEDSYGVPAADVGLSYVDTDGDEITLSTEEELREYYASTAGSTPKFVLKDLAQWRKAVSTGSGSDGSAATATPNTAAVTEMVIEEPELEQAHQEEKHDGLSVRSVSWEDLRGEALLAATEAPGAITVTEPEVFTYPPSPAAMVASLPVTIEEHDPFADHYMFVSDPQAMERDLRAYGTSPTESQGKMSINFLTGAAAAAEKAAETRDADAEEEVEGTKVDKGKGRAVDSPSLEERRNIVIEEVPDVEASEIDDDEDLYAPYEPLPSAPVHNEYFVSSPQPSEPLIDFALAPEDEPFDLNKALENEEDEFADPPLPTLPSAPTSEPAARPSLASDLTVLVRGVSSVLSGHPELSEGFRNLVRNARQVDYWQDAAREAAEGEFGERAQVVGQAAQRLGEALAGLFGALGLEGVTTPGAATAQTATNNDAAPTASAESRAPEPELSSSEEEDAQDPWARWARVHRRGPYGPFAGAWRHWARHGRGGFRGQFGRNSAWGANVGGWMPPVPPVPPAPTAMEMHDSEWAPWQSMDRSFPHPHGPGHGHGPHGPPPPPPPPGPPGPPPPPNHTHPNRMHPMHPPPFGPAMGGWMGPPPPFPQMRNEQEREQPDHNHNRERNRDRSQSRERGFHHHHLHNPHRGAGERPGPPFAYGRNSEWLHRSAHDGPFGRPGPHGRAGRHARDAAGPGPGPAPRHHHQHGQRPFGFHPGRYYERAPSGERSPDPLSPLLPSSPDTERQEDRERNNEREREAPGAPRFAPRFPGDMFGNEQREERTPPFWYGMRPSDVADSTAAAAAGFNPYPPPSEPPVFPPPTFFPTFIRPVPPMASVFANSPFSSMPRSVSAAATAGDDDDRRRKPEDEDADGIRVQPISPAPAPISVQIPGVPLTRSKTMPGITKATRFADEESGLSGLQDLNTSGPALGRSSSVADLHAAAPRGFGPRMRRAGSTRSLNVPNAAAGPSSERVVPLRVRLRERLIEMGFTDRPAHLMRYISDAIDANERENMTLEEYEEKLVTAIVERVLRHTGHGHVSSEEERMPGTW
ncbi:hypothetical protein CALCODRAFT_485077 [Calocera cornea HHB12733]|uniref:PB1 domain-containing protein n=1 Tax=Calocera cornea HHB12733 TaxID=1353952 RepID=A0A165EK56_9BASI|nr:hypothetical protein CALCODRAFT_485077 [Calocera cornea HHB12733]